MSDPKGNSLFCFPDVVFVFPDVSLDFVSGNIRTRGKTRLRAVSLFLQIYYGECTRAETLSGEAARRKKRGRASPVSRLQSRAWSFACLGRFARRTKKKERLLVV